MRSILFLSLALFGSPVAAHVGHLAEVAGHGHWLGAAALGAAIALGAWGARKGAKDEGEQAEGGEPAEDDAEVPA